MPRHKRGIKISQPGARNVAGRLCYAAAANALGGLELYGSTSLERALGFTPSSRVQRRAQSSVQASSEQRPRLKLPTGTCKKWLHGHVTSDQTISLIALTRPRAAEAIRRARDGDLVKAISTAESDPCFVAQHMMAVSEEAFRNYQNYLALGALSPVFVTRIAVELFQRALEGGGLTVLIALISFDRQVPYPRQSVAVLCLDLTLALALRNASRNHTEIAFAKEAINEAWISEQRKAAKVELRFNAEKDDAILEILERCKSS